MLDRHLRTHWGAQPEATGRHAPACRTFDPEAADFFYVPVYGTCMIFPVHCYADGPWFHVPSGERRGGLGWGGRRSAVRNHAHACGH